MVVGKQLHQESIDYINTLAKKCGTDKFEQGYMKYYAEYFDCLRERPIRLLEIGIQSGSSLRFWERYFLNARIWGLDIDASCKEHETDKTKVIIGDQENHAFLREVIDASGGNYDIVIDDGGHLISQQKTSFKVLFDSLKNGGIYVIEDLQTSY